VSEDFQRFFKNVTLFSHMDKPFPLVIGQLPTQPSHILGFSRLMTRTGKGRLTIPFQLRPLHMQNILADSEIAGDPGHAPTRFITQPNGLQFELPVIRTTRLI